MPNPGQGTLCTARLTGRADRKPSPENFYIPECFSPKYLKVPYIAEP